MRPSENWLKYKSVRNKVNDGIKYAKVAYYNNDFRETPGNTRESSKEVNMILGKNRHHTEMNSINIGDVACTSSS